MAQGTAIPFTTDGNGRTAQLASEPQAAQAIYLALSDNDNDNAFQQVIGLGTAATFSIKGQGFRAKVIARLFLLFADFEKRKRFKLVKETIRWESKAEETTLSFRYIDLETEQEQTFAKTFGS